MHKRTPHIGEKLRLKWEDGNLFFLPGTDDGTDLVVSVGWTFDFNEPLTYQDRGVKKSAGPGKARLHAVGEFAVFSFADGTLVPLEDVRPSASIRATLISFAAVH